MNSITADGDSECGFLAQRHFPDPVAYNRDPNHYSKGLVKDIEELAKIYPVLIPVVPALRGHFYVCVAWFGKKNDEAGFRRHWGTFLPHITDTDHSCCMHDPDVSVNKLLGANDPAIAALTKLLESFLEDAHALVHGFETNHLEALNGTFYVTLHIN